MGHPVDCATFSDYFSLRIRDLEIIKIIQTFEFSIFSIIDSTDRRVVSRNKTMTTVQGIVWCKKRRAQRERYGKIGRRKSTDTERESTGK